MRKVNELIMGRTRYLLSLMSVLAVCFLMSSTQLRSWGAHKTVVKMGGIAFIGLVATFKKNKSWDGMDENSQKFAEGMDVVLKDLALNIIDEAKMKEQFESFEAKYKDSQMTAEQKAAFTETTEAVSKMAQEIQKLKDAGFEAVEALPFNQAFAKALQENKDKIAAIKGNAKSEVNMSFKAAAVMYTTNVSANTAANMPGQPAMIEAGLASAPRNVPFILDFVDNGTTSSPTIQWFNKVNREDGTAMVAEGGLKPLSDFEVVGETTSVKKVATAFNVSEESLTDIPLLQSEINGEGVYNLKLGIEDQILNGDGSGLHLKGILAYAGAYALPSLNDSTESANEYDAILAAHTMLGTLNYTPNAVFVHPVTRYKLRTIKDKNGNYIIPPSADTNALNIDGLPVIAKNQITAGKFLMADFKKSHVRFLMDINVRVGYDSDDFRKNRVTFLVEARLGHYIRDVETSAFVYDEFDVVKAALESSTPV